MIGFERQQRRRRFVRGVLFGFVSALVMAWLMRPPR